MIHMTFDGLPPTVNTAYFTQVVRKGKKMVPIRTLTKEGKAYKRQLSTEITRRYGPELTFVEKDKPYGVAIRLILKNLVNKEWPARAETRYKKLDATNRIKLLEDALATALGVDDSQFLMVSVEKTEGSLEATHIWVWSITESHGTNS